MKSGKGPSFFLGALALAWGLPLAGCASHPAPVPAPVTSSVPILSFVTPWLGTEPRPDEESSPDLERVVAAARDARILGLGESLHGVHDLHRLAHRLFVELAARKDFSVYALEVDQAHGAQLDDYVHGRRDDLDSLLAARHPSAIFYDQALRELLIFLRQQNLEKGRDLAVAGFDLKQPALAMAGLARGLRRLDPGAADQAEHLFAEIAGLGGFGTVGNVSGYTGSLPIDLPPATAPRALRVRLRARGRGFSFGSAGLSAESNGSPWFRQSLVFSAGELGEDWQERNLEMTVPANATRLLFYLYHRGNGTVRFDGLKLSLDGVMLASLGLETWEVRPLLYPASQVMDYRARREAEGEAEGGLAEVLRIDCDERIDQALAAARELRRLVAAVLDREAGGLAAAESARLRQEGRLIEQAVEWRTLAQPNRDVFLAENLSWLAEVGFPGRKIVALAHATHSQRYPQRMGDFLAERYGSAYFTASMIPLSGARRDDDGPPTFELSILPIDPARASPLDRQLESQVPGDFLLDVAAARRNAEAARWLEQILADSPTPPAVLPEIAIYVREVGPFEPLPDPVAAPAISPPR